MKSENNFSIINSFPDLLQHGFDLNKHLDQFKFVNTLVHASSKNISFPEHGGVLSLKSTITGTEYYKVNSCLYAVSETNYLLVNNENYYSSFIDSISEVNSLTIHFAPRFVKEVTDNITFSDEKLLSDFTNFKNINDIEIIEKLYAKDNYITPVISELYKFRADFYNNILKIEELYILLLERIFIKHFELLGEIKHMPALKNSTKLEIYKRLTRAKDYIDSCYSEDITLHSLSQISWLNQSYFLREFKKYYKITPHQYLIAKRMDAAKRMLENDASIPITNVCYKVGYKDISSFSKLFKQLYNLPPEHYQKKGHKKYITL